MKNRQICFTVPNGVYEYLEKELARSQPHLTIAQLVRYYFTQGFGVAEYKMAKLGLLDNEQGNNR